MRPKIIDPLAIPACKKPSWLRDPEEIKADIEKLEKEIEYLQSLLHKDSFEDADDTQL